MNYSDPVYGTTQITESVLLDLINTPAMQRLKGVYQAGVSALVGVTAETTRFDHSLGVMLLVRCLGASLDDQVAALLHDISHTAFSHVIDYVFHRHDSQGYHDEKKLEYMHGTTLPATLTRHGYDWQHYVEDENFPLVRAPFPALCADRLDYFLRDSLTLKLGTSADVQTALEHLIVYQNRIVVDDLPIARWLGYKFIAANEASWANFREVGLYELAALAIRRGLEIGVLSEDDIWGTDHPAWEKLQASTDPELQYHLQRVNSETRFVWDNEKPEFWVSTKLRSIDPDIIINGDVKPLTTLDPDFARHRADFLEKNGGKWPMRVIGTKTDDR